jgi:hypothetical protein
VSTRDELLACLTESTRVMAENKEAYQAYIKARDDGSTAFCLYANRYGFREAEAAKKKAEEKSK